MEIDLALLADAATVDSAGKLNILGIFDRLTAGHFPAQHGRISLVLRFQATVQDAGRHQIQISFADPAGSELVGLNGEIQIGAGPQAAETGVRVPQVLNLDGVVFPTAGRYSFDVRIDGEHHVSIPLTVAGPPATGIAQA
jgi:Family of unknown function (DUF6941)